MWEDAPFGAHFLPWFLLGILQPHQKHGRDCAPLSFAMNGVRGRRNRVNRAMLKLLWWLVKNIILLPFLPIRLAWKETSREYYKDLTKRTASGEPLSMSRKVSGFQHFVRTVVLSVLSYILIYAIAEAIFVGR